jgi:hypothetical protein
MRCIIAVNQEAHLLALGLVSSHLSFIDFISSQNSTGSKEALKHSLNSSVLHLPFISLNSESSVDYSACLTQLMIVLWLMPVNRSISRNPNRVIHSQAICLTSSEYPLRE